VSDLASRYGAPHRLRRPAVLGVAVLLAAAFVAWLVWAVAFHGRPEVTSELVSYDVQAGEHATKASFAAVRRSADVTASCLLRAYAADHSVVGEATVTVGPGGATSSTQGTTVRTERRATSVELVGCTAEGQPQPR